MAATQATRTTSADDSLRAFRLVEALRKNDLTALQPYLAATPRQSAATRTSSSAAGHVVAATPSALHLAVQCARVGTIEYVLNSKGIEVNAVDATTGETALHLAARLGRADAVALLLKQPQINDDIADKSGRKPMDLAMTPEIAQMIGSDRVRFAEQFVPVLATYVSTGESFPVLQILNSPRSGAYDLTKQEPNSGTTLLHEAARRKDVELVKTILAMPSTDIFVRDRKGKTVYDVAKDDKIKLLLRAKAAETDATSAAATNRQGVDGFGTTETTMSRMASVPAGPGGSTLAPPPSLKGFLSKWTNYATGYKTRYFVLHSGILSYFRHQNDAGQSCRGAISLQIATVVHDKTDSLRFEIRSDSTRYHLRAGHPSEAKKWVSVLQESVRWFKANSATVAGSGSGAGGSAAAASSGGVSIHDLGSSASLSRVNSSLSSSALGSRTSLDMDGLSAHGGALGDHHHGHHRRARMASSSSIVSRSPSEDENESIEERGPPHGDVLAPLLNTLRTKLSLALDLVHANGESSRETLAQALVGLQSDLDDYAKMTDEREVYWRGRFEREVEAKRLWEENITVLAKQQAEMESVLEETMRANEKRKKQLKTVKGVLRTTQSPPMSPALSPDGTPAPAGDELAGRPRRQTINQAMFGAAIGNAAAANALSDPTAEDVLDQFTDDEEGDDEQADDFFEAVESQSLPLTVQPAMTENFKKPVSEMLAKKDMTQYKGYNSFRSQLPIKTDDRPTVSLWGILKSSIGKDLTKITLPVSFNEPTSMLQRMAEDMEFSECLDAAAAERDSLRRVAYVGAFAMSNYSSTIGRIAKPFNPLLGETFEYVRPDRQYRYFSEQVSHHPPMSACFGESPTWSYYGEVDAKSKFTGKSFEIRPTGAAHADLKIPKEWVASSKAAYPPCPTDATKVIEHYSWKKVTTSVSNFILGTPQIDHFGEMEITNHRTGEKCVLTFKPRGWRGKDANEVAGRVLDVQGNCVWEIAGKWSERLIARLARGGLDELKADDKHLFTKGESAQEYLLLWQNSPKPVMPFNLSPFAITLNDINDEIEPWLPPTDCRRRPDQRLFEQGSWEPANREKTRLEEKQRATKRLRESGQLPEHHARWFTRAVDPDSKEAVWLFKPSESADEPWDYWATRESTGKARLAGNASASQWPKVEEIF